MTRSVSALALLCILLLPHRLGAQERRPAGPRKLRAVSLRVLQETIQQTARPPAQALSLGGITRIAGYVVDEKSRDLVLLGEADPSAPGIRTADLAVALRYAWRQYGVIRGRVRYYTAPGCSIDPDPGVIHRLSEISERIGAQQPTEDIEAAIREWEAACETPQKVRVMGVPRNSHFANVMVDADYLLKHLADGSVAPNLPGITPLSDIAMAGIQQEISQGRPLSMPVMSLNRFWFYPGPNRYAEEKGIVLITECPVILLTEEQHLTRAGVKGTGRPDPLARQFAASFSAHYAQIAKKERIYSQLEQLFRLVALASIVKFRNEPVNLKYLLDRFPATSEEVAAALPGLSNVKHAAWQQPVERGTDLVGEYETVQNWEVWLPSCGGVNMDLRVKREHFYRPKGEKGKQVRRTRDSTLRARPSPKSLSWDVRLD